MAMRTRLAIQSSHTAANRDTLHNGENRLCRTTTRAPEEFSTIQTPLRATWYTKCCIDQVELGSIRFIPHVENVNECCPVLSCIVEHVLTFPCHGPLSAQRCLQSIAAETTPATRFPLKTVVATTKCERSTQKMQQEEAGMTRVSASADQNLY